MSRRRERGIALVLTLAVLAVLSLIVIGFLVSMRTEQTAARNQTYIIAARQLAQGALDEAIFMLRTNTPVLNGTDYYITQPGRAARNGAVFDDRLFSVFTPLSSAGTININADQNVISSNALYTTTASRQVFVDWVNVATNGSASGVALIGRYAYWVDDEASKININFANRRANTSASTNGTSPADLDLTVLLGVGTSIADNSWMHAQTNGFFTTESWKDTPSVGVSTYGFNQSFLTAYSQNQDASPLGGYRKNLNDPSNGLTRADVDTANVFSNQALGNFFGVGNDFSSKYGLDRVKQILANMYDFRREAGGGSGSICTGAELANLDANALPTYYCGLRRYPFLNEVGLMASYCRPVATQIQAKVTIFVELVNPYNLPWGNGGEIRITMDKLRFNVIEGTGAWNYDTGPDTGWQVAWQTGVNGFQSAQELIIPIAGNIPANSYATYTATAWAEQIENDVSAYVDQVGVNISRIRLLQTANASESIRDWAAPSDLSQQTCIIGTLGNSQFCFTNTGPNTPSIQYLGTCALSATYDATQTEGIAKNDPRVRTFSGWSNTPRPAWTRIGAISTTLTNTLNADNSNVVDFTSATGIVNLPSDPSDGAGYTVTNRSTFFAKTAASGDVDYETTGELGYIHTGLNWRTLNLLPQSPIENGSNYVPDWVVLDLFTVTNATTLPGRINLNAQLTNWSGAGSLLRSYPIASLGSNLNLSGVGPFVAIDVLTQRFENAFSSRPYAANFFSNAYTFAGQICEVDGLGGSSGTPKAQRESRIRSLANLITVRSDQFTVWGVAQAIQDVNNNGTFDAGTDVIAAESKVQAVVERYVEAGQAKFRILYFRYYAE